MSLKLDVPSSELKFWSSDLGVWSSKLEIPSSDLGVWSSKLEIPSSDLGVWSSKLEIPSSDLGVWSSDLGVWSSDLGVPSFEANTCKIKLIHQKILKNNWNNFRNTACVVSKLDPKYAWAIVSRGETYLMLKLYNEALVDFNRAIDLDSDSDWRLYYRALNYLALNQPDKARTDLALAIKLAKEHFQKDPKDWRNSFNLALYYLAAQHHQPAEQLYRYTISQAASLECIREAIQDLNDFLTIFPNHVQATSMQKLLLSSLT